jgi:hypothetical protein
LWVALSVGVFWGGDCESFSFSAVQRRGAVIGTASWELEPCFRWAVTVFFLQRGGEWQLTGGGVFVGGHGC